MNCLVDTNLFLEILLDQSGAAVINKGSMFSKN